MKILSSRPLTTQEDFGSLLFSVGTRAKEPFKLSKWLDKSFLSLTIKNALGKGGWAVAQSVVALLNITKRWVQSWQHIKTVSGGTQL